MRISCDFLMVAALSKLLRFKIDGPACMVFLLGLLATWGLWLSSDRSYQRSTQDYFDFRVQQLLVSIDTRLEAYRQVLYGARGLFAASDTVTREEFRNYVDTLQLGSRYPGIQGVGFSLLVPNAEKINHLQAMQQQGFSDYQLYPSGEREAYTSIIYLEPFSGHNLRAFGYDMFSEPVRRQAMIYARDNDRIAVSGKVTLMQEDGTNNQSGFLMYLPVYLNGYPHQNEAQRRTNIRGWVYSPFWIGDFMSGIGGKRARDLHLSIYDGDSAIESNLMYSDSLRPLSADVLVATKQLQLGGHYWTLVVRSQPTLTTWPNNNQAQIILISGLALSLLLALLIREVAARGQALALAETGNRELQESEARFRLMADSAPVLIWVMDQQQTATWFNTRWLEFTGRTMMQEIGHGWLESVCPSQVELVVKLLSWHFQVRKPFSVEYRLRRYDGEYRWIIDSGVPRFDENGEFFGFIGSCIDISEHKQMEEELWELATTDGLTGFLNRRHFMVRLQEEFERMQRNKQLVSSVLMLDIDYFKRVNDAYGHAAGDAVLQHFANIIRSQQRKIDVVGRLGGEEFAIVLPDTNIGAARVFAERLRQAMADSELWQQGNVIRFTVSIGIALLSATCECPDSVLREADRALYAAKEGGRNRVVLARD